ncbi:MAG: hypothetical protein ACXWDN_06475 [Limisphaerales bacterium]
MNTQDFKLERDLHFRIRGQPSTGKLLVGGVSWVEEKKKWACAYSLAHVVPEGGRIYGDDPLDAVSKTLDFLSSLIRGSEDDGLVVWWKVEGDHGGLSFPMCESESWRKNPK